MTKYTDTQNENAEAQSKVNAELLLEIQSKMAIMVAIVESTDDAIIGKSLQGIIKSWNPASERMYGYTAQEAIGQNINMIIPAELHAQELEVFARLGNNEILHFESVRRNKNGNQFDVSVTASPMHDFDGVVVGASCIERDITVQKKMQEDLTAANLELKKSNDRFYMIYELNPVPMMMSNFDTSKIQNVNKRFLELFGFTKEEVIGKTAIELMVYEPESEKKIKALLDEKSTEDGIETVATKKNGEQFAALATAKVIYLDEVKHILGSFQDISKRKEAEIALKEKTTLLEQQNAELERLNKELAEHIAEKEQLLMQLSLSSGNKSAG